MSVEATARGTIGSDQEGSTSVVLSAEELIQQGLTEDRFRIDRKKLEDMLQTPESTNISPNDNAEAFFQKVMADTSTQISWPSKLKIGAKSKKDPHVKILGKPENVFAAKKMILQVLDTKQKNRVTLKMDVSHTDHSYVIGKGGFKIQQVMEETGCHIHFPDSNRNNVAEKSNQVSIAGEADGVEMARNKIRELLPLVFMFKLHGGVPVSPGDESTPALQHIQQTYSFNIVFKNLPSGEVFVIVRGCQRLISRLRQGLKILMECLTGSQEAPIHGFMKTEIAVQHHTFVMGVNMTNVQKIMNNTGAVILFPNSSSPLNTFGVGSPQALPLTPSGHLGLGAIQTDIASMPHILQSKTSVLIHGSFDSVCLAWQELLRYLPLTLMFDLKEGLDVDAALINRLMEIHNITIILRPKVRENLKSVILRGAEQDGGILFQVRKSVLGMQEQFQSSPTSGLGMSSGQQFQQVPANSHWMGNSNTNNDLNGPANPSALQTLNCLSNFIQQNPQILGVLNTLSNALPSNPRSPTNLDVTNAQMGSNSMSQYSQASVFHQQNFSLMSDSKFKNDDAMSRTYPNDFANGLYARRFGTSKPPPFLPPPLKLTTPSITDDNDSGVFVTSRARMGNSSLPESNSSSAASSINGDVIPCQDSKDNNSFGNYYKDKDSMDLRHLVAEYENKKIVAAKAMHQPIREEVRTPTTLWSGCGFSKSTPATTPVQTKNLQTKIISDDYQDAQNFSYCKKLRQTSTGMDDLSEGCSTPSYLLNQMDNLSLTQMDSSFNRVPSPFTMSNCWDGSVATPSIFYGAIKSLPQLLSYLKLEKYEEVFNDNEIDLQMFLSLTDMDLQQLNISYFARRRMLSAISAMRDQKTCDAARQFQAAPGAERKPRNSA